MGKKMEFDLAEFRKIRIPSEPEIMAGWRGDFGRPIVTVLCSTYNQDIYIEDAIRGILIQKTDFPFEVIIHDDASTDRTAEIVLEYAKRYPNLIKPILQKENQHKLGNKPSSLSLPSAKGDYIAWCEGDDFWIKKDKLCKQLEAARKYNCDLVFTSASILSGRSIIGRMSDHYDKSRVVSLKQVVFGGGAYCPTPSLFIAKQTVACVLKQEWFRTAPVGDVFFQAAGAARFGAYFIAEDTCVYRTFARGSWTAKRRTYEEIDGALERMIISIEGLASILGDNSKALSRQMLANTYYLHGLHHLKERNYISFSSCMTQANQLVEERSKGFALFCRLRTFPRLARFLASCTIFSP